MTGKIRLRLGPMLLCLILWSCESTSGWEGRYISQPESDPTSTVTLILASGGKGRWIIDQESTPLLWELHAGSLLLHFKTGGVVIARYNPSGQILTVEILDSMTLLLHKSP